MGVDVSKIGSTLVEQFVGFSSEKIYPNSFLSAKAVGEGAFGRNENDGYGGVLAISENYAVVGVPNQSYDYQGQNMDTGSGAVYVYERDAETWVYLQKLSIPDSDRATGNSFGYSVAVDGSTIVVGAPGVSSDKGAAYVYGYAAKNFEFTQKIVPTGPNSAGTADRFGSSVSINGDMIIVGAPEQGYDNSGQNVLTNSGAAWVYVYDNMSLIWNQVQKIAEDGNVRNPGDMFGSSMASNSSYIVVGAPDHSYTGSGENFLSNAGAAYIWSWNSVDNSWTLLQKITSSNRVASGYFGSNVALDGSTVVVTSGGYTDGTSMMGAVSVFELQGNTWSEVAFFQPDLGSYVDSSYTYSPSLNIGYGNAIDINGSTIAVGIPSAPLSISGKLVCRGLVASYTKTTSWQLSQLIANPHFNTSLQTTTDNFGSSVSLGSEALVVGFPNDGYDDTDTNKLTNAGSVYLYTYTDNTWVIEQKIVGWGQDRNSGDEAGAAIWYQDGYAFVGAPGHSYDSDGTNYLSGAGAVFIWQWTGSDWAYTGKVTSTNRQEGASFGSAIAGDTGVVVVGAPTSTLDSSNNNPVANAGSVYVLNLNNGIWSVVEEITASVRNINDGFGSSVSINGSDLIVGMPTNSTTTANVYSSSLANTGAAEFYSLVDGSWTFSERVFAGDNRTAGDKYGHSVSVNSGVAVVGAPAHSYDGDGLHMLSGAGAAWIYTKDTSGSWTQTTKITGWGQDRNISDNMGWSSASDNDTLVIGVPNHSYDTNGRNYVASAGAVLVYIWYNGGWFFQQKLIAQTNRTSESVFGYSVDISGDTLVVGAPQSGTYGRAYIFNRSFGVWSQTQEIDYVPYRSDYQTVYQKYYTKTSGIGDCSENFTLRNLYSFGAAVSIDDTSLVIGFPLGFSQNQEDIYNIPSCTTYPVNFTAFISATNVNPCGTSFAYSNLNGTWTLESEINAFESGTNGYQNDNYGITVSVKNDVAVVGCPMQGYDESGANNKTNAGAVYIFRRTANGSSFVWNFEQKLAGGTTDRYANDQLGTSAAIDGSTIAVAAINHPYDSNDTNYFSNAGAVYIWTYENGELSFQQKLSAQGTNSRNTNAYFGSSIALDGDMIAIGAPGTSYDVNQFSPGANYGAVFVFVRTNNNWAIQEWLSPPSFDSNGNIVTSTSGTASTFYGSSISLLTDNNVTRLLVGSSGYPNSEVSYTGAAFTYTYDNQEYEWDYEHKFTNPYNVSGSFGSSTTLSDNIAVIGCPAAQNGPTQTVSYNFTPGGAAIYVFNDSTWSLLDQINGPNRDNITGDTFGYSMDIDGTVMVVGAPNNAVDDNGVGNSSAGAAYVYNWNGSEWSFAKKLSAPDQYRSNNDKFGYDVSVSGTTIAIGAPQTSLYESGGTVASLASSGAVYVFDQASSKTKKVVRREVLSADTTWVVPSNIADSSIKISMWGGAGGSATSGSRTEPGGAGGYLSLRLPVSAGDTIKGLIGQAGGSSGGVPGSTSGSLYKGGQGSSTSTGSGGSGGSASALMLNGSTIAIAAGGGGSICDNNGSIFAPPVSVPSSTVFSSSTSGQDAISGTSYTLAGGGGGYRGGVTAIPTTSDLLQTMPSTSGMSWVDPSVTTYFMGTTQNPWITDGTSTIGYNGTAGSVSGANSYPGLIVIEWYESQTVYDYTYTTQLVPTGTNAHMANDNFGFSVGVSEGYIAAGAPYHGYDESGSNLVTNAGAGWIFEFTNNEWSQITKITCEGTNGRNANDFFGYSIGINSGFVIVGAPQHGYDDYGANLVTNNGAAWVFQNNDGVWTSVAKLVEFGRDKNTGDLLGTSIACDGSVCVVGAPGNSYDATLDASGKASYTNLNYMQNSGSAYIWEWNTSTSSWDFTQKIVARDRFKNYYFGSSVSISNSKILIGNSSTSTSSSSSAYMFEKTSTYPTAWQETNNFTSDTVQYYGNSVAIDGDTLAISGLTRNNTGNVFWSYDTFINGNTAVLGTDDFTIETIVDYNNQTQTYTNEWAIVSSGNYSYHHGAGTWGIYISFVTGGLVIDNGTDRTSVTLPFGNHHIAWTRTSGVSILWVDGKEVASFQDSTNYSDSTVVFNNTTNKLIYGKITDKVAIYTSSFTAPTILTQDSNTSVFTTGPEFPSAATSVLDIYNFSDSSWTKTASFTNQSSIDEEFGTSIALNEKYGMILVSAPKRSMDDTGTNSVTGAGGVFSYLRDSSGTWTANQILVGQGQDSNPGDMIGSAMSADGNALAISSPAHAYDEYGSSYMSGAGAVWIWRYYGTTPSWNLEQKIIPSDRAPGDEFGSSLCISGNTLVVGSPGKNNSEGAAYVFNRPSTITDGTVNCWTQTAILLPTGTNAINTGDKFGYSIDVQESTMSVVVGAPYHGYDDTGTNFLTNAGAAWSFSGSTGSWVQSQKLIANGVMNGQQVPNARNANDNFGYSVGLKDNSLIIGAVGHAYDKAGTNPLVGAGAAFLFIRTDNTHPWSAVIKLTGDSPERNINDYYGYSIASTSNTIVIGSPNQSYDGNGDYWVNEAGAVYVWFNDGTNGWSLQQKLSAQDGTLSGNTLREAGDKFGSSVAISGDTLVVGIPYRSTDVTGATAMSNAGAIMVFRRSNNKWSPYGTMIQGSDTTTGDTFGYSIDFDGTTIAVGAPTSDLDSSGSNSVSSAGSVYLFTDNGTQYVQETKLVPTGSNARNSGDQFGFSVSVQDSTLVVGSPYHDYDDTGANSVSNAGAAWVFIKDDTSWTQIDKIVDFTQRRSASDAFASSSYVFNDSYLVVGAPGYSYDSNSKNYQSGAGAVYVFERSGSSFTYMQTITPIGENMRSAGDAFGTSVAIDGTTIVASSPMASFDSSGVATSGNTGLVFVFDLSGSSFTQTSVLNEFGTNSNTKGDEFGYAISINGDYIISTSINHPYDSNGENSLTGAGAAWIFYKDSTAGWTTASKLTPSGNNARNEGDNFGYAVDIDGTSQVAVVSSIVHGYDAAGLTNIAGSGAAWAFISTSSDPKVWTQEHKLVPTGTERTSSDAFGSYASYDASGILAVSDSNPTDNWYENPLDGTGSVHIFKPSTTRTGVTLNGTSAYMDISSVANSLTDSTWSISSWLKNNTYPSSDITHECFMSVKHGNEVMRVYFTTKNKMLITYGITNIIADISAMKFFDGLWHNLIVSGLGSTDVSGIAVYIDGKSAPVTASIMNIEYPTDYVSYYSLDGNSIDMMSANGEFEGTLSYSDASTLQTNRDALTLDGSNVPSLSSSFIQNSSMTLSFWVYATQSTSSTGNTSIVSQLLSSDGTAAGSIFLFNVACNDKGQIFTQYNNSPALTSTTILNPNTWYNIVVTLDLVNNILGLSVNGTQITETISVTGNTSTNPLLLGSAGNYTTDSSTGPIPNYSNLVGMITDMKFYNRSLSTDEVITLNEEFINQPIDNGEVNNTDTVTTVSAGLIPVSGDQILIGAGVQKNFAPGEYYSGVISDVAVINGSVTSDEVQTIVSSGKNEGTNGIVGNWIV